MVETLLTTTVPWETAKLIVPVEACNWPEGRAERVSVGSYGIGGSNVHVSLGDCSSA